MSNKRITDVDHIDAIFGDESFFVNQNNSLKQIKKSDINLGIISGGTGANNAEDARANLGAASSDDLNNLNQNLNNAISQKSDPMCLLWKNENTRADFEAKTLDIDLSMYSHILIDFNSSYGSSILKKGENNINSSTVTSTEANSIVVEIRKRMITVYNDSIVFGNAQHSMYTISNSKFSDIQVSNSSLKPIRIYGLKSVSLL